MQSVCALAAASLGFNICNSDAFNLSVNKELETEFAEHVALHGVSFGTTEEYQFRLEQYAIKDAEIKEINATNGGKFTVGHNFMSTWSHEEYKQLLGYRGPKSELTSEENVTILDTVNLPASVDWRELGAVNPVQNQARCGSCWSFSATVAIEGAHFNASGDLLKLSEQQFVDCDSASYGCNGGWQKNAFVYAENMGQELESAYPYAGVDGTCTADASSGKVDVKSYTNVKAKSVEQLKAAIAVGPVSVTIEADTRVFQMYTGGILDSSKCGTSLDHAVAAVGYGTENGEDYYIVRNSWSANWGEEGYIRIAAVKGHFGRGICGIQQISLYPTTD